MKCVVVTDFNAWDFENIKSARAWFNKLVEYTKTHEDGAEFVELFKSSDFYDESGADTFPIECYYD